MRQRPAIGVAFTLVLALLLAACDNSTAGPVGPTATGSPPPLTPAGDYAFVRNGDIWVRQGLGNAHQATRFRLNYGSGAWGDLTWSPDHAWLAFALRAQGVAPGLDASNPLQATGTLFVLRVATDQTTRLLPQTADFTVPLVGHHLAWLDNQTLLFTSAGAVDKIGVNENLPFTPLVGPTHVWEIAARGPTLWYSTLTALSPTGLGSAELHRFDLNAQTDQRAVVLGPAQLLPQICDLICPPDDTTPIVPYAWDVSPDGKTLAYQTNITQTGAKPTPTPKATPSPTPATAVSSYFVVPTSGSALPQPAFTNVDQPAGRARLAFAPDGQRIALALDESGIAPFGPYVQNLTGGAAQALTWQVNATPVALTDVSWTSDGSGLTLTALPLVAGGATTSAVTLYQTGGQGYTEQNADELVWGM